MLKLQCKILFNKRYEIDVDINNYKLERYQKVEKMAKRFAKVCQKSRIDMKLDPLPADEREVDASSYFTYELCTYTKCWWKSKNRF